MLVTTAGAAQAPVDGISAAISSAGAASAAKRPLERRAQRPVMFRQIPIRMLHYNNQAAATRLFPGDFAPVRGA